MKQATIYILSLILAWVLIKCCVKDTLSYVTGICTMLMWNATFKLIKGDK